MMRIGRDHGKFLHEVGELPMSELIKYEAFYRYEHEELEKEKAKAKAKAGNA